MDINNFLKVFYDLGFKFNPENVNGIIIKSWYKSYGPTQLWIAYDNRKQDGVLFACLRVGKVEIMLPNVTDTQWIIDFDTENTNV